MKFTIPTKQLKEQLAKLGAPPGQETAQLGSLAVIITASGFEGVTLRRTTAHSNVTTTLAADVADDGEVGVDHELLSAALGGFYTENVELEVKGNKLEVQSGRSRATLGLYNPEDLLPEQPDGKPHRAISFASTDLAEHLASTSLAACDDAARGSLCGVCVRLQQGRVSFMATDGRRISVVFLEPSKEPFGYTQTMPDPGVLIPNECMAFIRKLVAGEEARVDIEFSERSMLVKYKETRARLQVAESQPPNLDKVLPWGQERENEATCSRADLLRYAGSCVPIGVSEYKVIGMKLEPGAVVVEADNERGTTVTHEVFAETTVKQGSVGLRVTGQFLIDFLNSAKGESVTIGTHDKGRMISERSADRFNVLLLVRDANKTP